MGDAPAGDAEQLVEIHPAIFVLQGARYEVDAKLEGPVVAGVILRLWHPLMPQVKIVVPMSRRDGLAFVNEIGGKLGGGTNGSRGGA